MVELSYEKTTRGHVAVYRSGIAAPCGDKKSKLLTVELFYTFKCFTSVSCHKTIIYIGHRYAKQTNEVRKEFSVLEKKIGGGDLIKTILR